MRLELKNVQTVVTVARSKLQSYLQTIRRNVPKQSPTEVTEALDGIEELCNFLDVKFMFPLHSRTGPIDQALEANEQHLKNQQRQRKKTESSKDTTNNDLNSMPNVASNKSTTSQDHSFGYELPEDGFMPQTSRMLGNIKEIELIPIVSDEKIADRLNVNSNTAIDANISSNGGLPVADPLCLKSY